MVECGGGDNTDKKEKQDTGAEACRNTFTFNGRVKYRWRDGGLCINTIWILTQCNLSNTYIHGPRIRVATVVLIGSRDSS